MESEIDKYAREWREEEEAKREAFRKEHGLNVQEYKSFNKEHSFQDLRIDDILKKDYNAEEKIKKIDGNTEERQKSIKEVMPENDNYGKSVKKNSDTVLSPIFTLKPLIKYS